MTYGRIQPISHAMDEKELGRTIRAAREAKKWTQTQLGKPLGVTRNSVSNWETGKNPPTLAHLMDLADLLDSDPLRALTKIKTPDEYEQPITTEPLPIRGEIRPWAWLEIDHIEQDYGTVPIHARSRYAGVTQFALRLMGRSNDFVIVADWDELGRELRVNDTVVIRRELSRTYETTMRRARKGKDGLELWPEPSDPRQKPIPWPERPRNTGTKIIGLVIGYYTEVD
jgi:transcriptional regulator with XRE-family HTH domain